MVSTEQAQSPSTTSQGHGGGKAVVAVVLEVEEVAARWRWWCGELQ